MSKYALGVMEQRFADIVWENQPLRSSALVDLCAEQLNWKRTTTYTVLKRLIDRGIFKNEKCIVSALMTREEFNAQRSQAYVEEQFSDSLPAFFAAFTSSKKLSTQEVDELKLMIDAASEA